MFHIKNCKFGVVAAVALLTLLAVPPMALAPAAEHAFEVIPWTDGVVHYKFNEAVAERHRRMIRDEMDVWETAMTIEDPAGGPARKYIMFEECSDCTTDYVFIRYRLANEDGNYCHVGMNPGNRSLMYLYRGVFGSPNNGPNTIRHELGHCLGLWHEFNREDADRWLVEDPDLDEDCVTPEDDGDCFPEYFNTRAAQMPMLGNYDYDSIMHYNYHNVTDRMGNYFGRYNLDRGDPPPLVSEQDKSRLLQYYAQERRPEWGFFESLSITYTNPDRLPNPYLEGDILVGGVWAVGTPAIAFQSSGNFDIFARGSDNHIYWKAFRDNEPDEWVSLGCCFGSDPSALSSSDGEIDLVAVGAITGKLMHSHYENDEWGTWPYVQGGYPAGGIKQSENGGYIGPAIASRRADSLDVFVVRSDGLLAVTTLSNGAWTAWSTLGDGYNVTARPAAVALSANNIQLAINESDFNLYEPQYTFRIIAWFFNVGTLKGTTSYQAPPALTKRTDQTNPYRVFITNADGRISHRFALGFWRDIGGIPKPGTGPSAVATGRSSVLIVMNGEDATGCSVGCASGSTNPNQVIQAGGLWLRRFE